MSMQRPKMHQLAASTSTTVVALAALSLHPSLGSAQTPAPDSLEIVERMHELQAEFEAFRESRTPLLRDRVEGRCDERIGRICIWFGGEAEEGFPAELREVGQARVQLIRELLESRDWIADRWVLGQLVHYLVENRDVQQAERVATECGIVEEWWCSALHGYVLHVWTRYVDAEEAFRRALEQMPPDVLFAWTSPRYLLTPGAVQAFDALPPEERALQFEIFWRLSDPLFLFEGNDRLTDHFARLVIAENRRYAVDPLGLGWDADLEETLIRYGRNTGYSRTHDPEMPRRRGGALDTRRMVGHHDPKSRGYLFPERYLESPSDIPPESWITAPREARTWYAPPYAPEIRGLETQVARFRRDGEMLIVGAYRPTLPAPGSPDDEDDVVAAWGPEGGVRARPYAALFLVPLDGLEPVFVRGDDPEGVLTLQAWPGRYVSGIEVVDPEGRRGWRARQGLVQRPLERGMVDVSDLLILKADAPLPVSLDEALVHARPGVRLRAGERFPVAWEAYGLGIQEPVRVTIGFSRGRPGFLERVGDFLGIIEPERSVDITFDDVGPDEVQTVFRAIELQLPDLDPGAWTLHLQLELPGRTPIVTSRPIIVER